MSVRPDLRGGPAKRGSAALLVGRDRRDSALSEPAGRLEHRPPSLYLRQAALRRPWLCAAETWQCAPRRLAPIALDSLVVAVCIGQGTDSPWLALVAGAGFPLAGLLFGLYLHRTCVASQGVLWYDRRLLAPLVLTGAAVLLAAGHATSFKDAAEGVALAAVVLTSIHTLLWLAVAAARRGGNCLRPTLVVGARAGVEHLRHRLNTFPEAGLSFAAGYSPLPGEGEAPDGGRGELSQFLASHAAGHVVIVSDGLGDDHLQRLVRFTGQDTDITLVAAMNNLCAHRLPAHLGDRGVVPLTCNASRGSRAAKRALDLVAATALLIATSPLLLAAALAIRMHDPGPVIFRQERVGLAGTTFTIYKLRSMVADAERLRSHYLGQNVNQGLLFKIDGDPRVTAVGSLIRRFSIDELPQLFNVIKGDMSLVGPRPLPVAPEEFSPAAQVRHSVLPGITGLWQINGGNALVYDDMLQLDLAYVMTHSLGSDLKILARTPAALVVRRSAY